MQPIQRVGGVTSGTRSHLFDEVEADTNGADMSFLSSMGASSVAAASIESRVRRRAELTAALVQQLRGLHRQLAKGVSVMQGSLTADHPLWATREHSASAPATAASGAVGEGGQVPSTAAQPEAMLADADGVVEALRRADLAIITALAKRLVVVVRQHCESLCRFASTPLPRSLTAPPPALALACAPAPAPDTEGAENTATASDIVRLCAGLLPACPVGVPPPSLPQCVRALQRLLALSAREHGKLPPLPTAMLLSARVASEAWGALQEAVALQQRRDALVGLAGSADEGGDEQVKAEVAPATAAAPTAAVSSNDAAPAASGAAAEVRRALAVAASVPARGTHPVAAPASSTSSSSSSSSSESSSDSDSDSSDGGLTRRKKPQRRARNRATAAAGAARERRARLSAYQADSSDEEGATGPREERTETGASAAEASEAEDEDEEAGYGGDWGRALRRLDTAKNSAQRQRMEARLQAELAAAPHRDDALDDDFLCRIHDGYAREAARRELDQMIYQRLLAEWRQLKTQHDAHLRRAEELKARIAAHPARAGGEEGEEDAAGDAPSLSDDYIQRQLAVPPLPPPPRKPATRMFLSSCAQPRPTQSPQTREPSAGDVLLSGGLFVQGELYDRLLEYQQQGLQWLWELFRHRTGGILADEMGLGKCWGTGTQLLMFDGRLKRVEDVVRDSQRGEPQLLMGDDSAPRRVLPGSEVHAVGSLYRVCSHDPGRDSWTCNADHILVLRLRDEPSLLRADSGEYHVHQCRLRPGHDDCPPRQRSMLPRREAVAGPFADAAAAETALADCRARNTFTFECTMRDYLSLDADLRARCRMFQPAAVLFPPPPADRRLGTLLQAALGEDVVVSDTLIRQTAWALGLRLAARDRCMAAEPGVLPVPLHCAQPVPRQCGRGARSDGDDSCSAAALCDHSVPRELARWLCAMHPGDTPDHTSARITFGPSPTSTALTQCAVECGSVLDSLVEAYALAVDAPLPLALLTEDVAVRRALLAGIAAGHGCAPDSDVCVLRARERAVLTSYVHLARGLGCSVGPVEARAWPEAHEAHADDLCAGYSVRVAGPAMASSSSQPDLPLLVDESAQHCRAFTVTAAGEGEYWGFTLDGDGRCLLGDFTVTHNTVQVAALLSALEYTGWLRAGAQAEQCGVGRAHPVLLVSPASVVSQWVAEVHVWAPQCRVFSIPSSCGARAEDVVQTLRETALNNDTLGVLVLSYNTLLQYPGLAQHKWSLAVLDEGHKIKNPETQIAQLVKRLPTRRRLILTGTPVQNSLVELWALMDFARPGGLGDLQSFEEGLVQVVERGGYANASETMVRAAIKCSRTIRELVRPFILQRRKRDVAASLPAKREEVVLCSMTRAQWGQYRAVLDQIQGYVLAASHPVIRGGADLFSGLTLLRKACNHPDLVSRPELASDGDGADEYDGAAVGDVDSDLSDSEVEREVRRSARMSAIVQADSDARRRRMRAETHRPASADPFVRGGSHGARSRKASAAYTAAPGKPARNDPALVPVTGSALALPLHTPGHPVRSGKLLVLLQALRSWYAGGHRCLVFAQTRQCLDLLEACVRAEGYTYMRLDGNTRVAARAAMVNKFNSDEQVFVFLLTTRAGGLGLNLTGADRVVIFDPDWNPATDAQARERCYRLGQSRPVCIYRFALRGTVEERVVQRQAFKEIVASGVMGGQEGRRVALAEDELKDLLILPPRPSLAEERKRIAAVAGGGLLDDNDSDDAVAAAPSSNSRQAPVPVPDAALLADPTVTIAPDTVPSGSAANTSGAAAPAVKLEAQASSQVAADLAGGSEAKSERHDNDSPVTVRAPAASLTATRPAAAVGGSIGLRHVQQEEIHARDVRAVAAAVRATTSEEAAVLRALRGSAEAAADAGRNIFAAVMDSVELGGVNADAYGLARSPAPRATPTGAMGTQMAENAAQALYQSAVARLVEGQRRCGMAVGAAPSPAAAPKKRPPAGRASDDAADKRRRRAPSVSPPSPSRAEIPAHGKRAQVMEAVRQARRLMQGGGADLRANGDSNAGRDGGNAGSGAGARVKEEVVEISSDDDAPHTSHTQARAPAPASTVTKQEPSPSRLLPPATSDTRSPHPLLSPQHAHAHAHAHAQPQAQAQVQLSAALAAQPDAAAGAVVTGSSLLAALRRP